MKNQQAPEGTPQLSASVALLKSVGEPVTADGAVAGTAAVLRTVSSEQVERRLCQLDALLLHSPDAVTVHDRAGQIVEWSAAAERMFGWTRAEMLTSDDLRPRTASPTAGS